MIREDISRLSRNRPIYFKIGMLIALSFVIWAFNWTVYPDDLILVEEGAVEEELVEIIPNTPPEKPQLPPPILNTNSKADDFDFQEILPPEPVPPMPITPNPSPRPEPGPVTYPEPSPPVPLPLPKVEEPAAPLIFAEVMPRFPGCEEAPDLSDDERRQCANIELLKYVQQHLKYPAIARENDIQGTVVVQFVIEKDGTVTEAKVMKDIGGGCGREALRVVNTMPVWRPGKQRGRPVRVMMNLPVKFKLQ